MSDDNAVKSIIEIPSFWNFVEIRKTTTISVMHMHAAIEHDSLSIDFDYYTAFSNVLTSTCTRLVEIDNRKRDSIVA